MRHAPAVLLPGPAVLRRAAPVDAVRPVDEQCGEVEEVREGQHTVEAGGRAVEEQVDDVRAVVEVPRERLVAAARQDGRVGLPVRRRELGPDDDRRLAPYVALAVGRPHPVPLRVAIVVEARHSVAEQQVARRRGVRERQPAVVHHAQILQRVHERHEAERTPAHHEAEGAENGVGIVKLMGRDSGFIAATAALANSVVDFCLVPEFRFSLGGATGLLESLTQRLEENHHAVIVVAEGAGQELFDNSTKSKDPSGNVIKDDIGERLNGEIVRHFSASNIAVSVKYLDPSYHIRSVPAIASDAVFCYQLAEHAVHAGMAGKTNLLIGHWNNFFTHVPIALATEQRRVIDLDSALWKGVLCATQQDRLLG